MSAFATTLRQIADEIDAAEKAMATRIATAEDAVEEAQGRAWRASEEVARATTEVDVAEQTRDDALSDIEKILEAAIAAREGRPGAAAGTVRLILDLQPDLVAEVPHLTLLARVRPADYWSH